ncbi:7967_t:CDS:2, partial [Funneliformis geosporum]
QNIVVKNALIEDKTNMQENKAKAKVQKLQADQHVTIAMVTTGQIQQYAKSTTTKISKKFLNEKERTVKRTRTYKESNNNDNTENDHLLLLDEKSSTVSTQDQFSLMINHPMMNLRMTETMLIIKSMMIVKNSPFSLLGRNDTKDGTQIPPHQITGNTFFAQSSASETHESILRASSENLTGLNKVKVCITNALIVNDEDTEEITRLKKYLYRVMLPLIESFLKPIPDISAQTVVNITIGRSSDIVFSLMLYKNLQNGSHQEIFVGEQAGPHTKSDLTKLSMNSFKFYRELRDCLNVRILNAMKIRDMVIKTELKYTAEIENDNDKAQILKRKFSDFIQTKPSPIKVAKVKK